MMLYNSTISVSKKVANASADVAKYDCLEKTEKGDESTNSIALG
jgi:hypothetical protein